MEGIKSKDYITNLPGVSEIIESTEGLTQNEILIQVVESIGKTVDSQAMIEIICQEAGFNKRQEEYFRGNNPPYVSPICKKAKDPSTVIVEVCRVAVAEARKLLDMTPEQINTLPEKERKVRDDLLQNVAMLIIGYGDYVTTDGSDGFSRRGLANLVSDVTEADRQLGVLNPEQRRFNGILQRVTDGNNELAQRIIDKTNLHPSRLASVALNRAIPDDERVAIEAFLGECNTDPITNAYAVRLYEKMWRKYGEIGVDLDFCYRLNQLPHGENMVRTLSKWAETAREDLHVLIPYFTGRTIEDLRRTGQPVSILSLMQNARRHAYANSKRGNRRLTTEDLAGYIEEVDSPEKEKSDLDALLSTYPMMRRIVGTMSLTSSLYTSGRPVNISFFVEDEFGKPVQRNFAQVDVWGASSSERRRIFVHEGTHAVERYLMGLLVENGIEGSWADVQTTSKVAEFWAVISESGLLLSEEQSIPEMPEYPGSELKNSEMAKSMNVAWMFYRQAGFAMCNDSIHRAIIGRMMANKGVLTECDVESIVREQTAKAREVYERLGEFGNLMTIGRSIITEISTPGDGAWYLPLDGFDPEDVGHKTEASAEPEAGDVKDEQAVTEDNVQESAVKALEDRFGKGWLSNQQARAVFLYAILNAPKDKSEGNLGRFVQIFKTMAGKEAIDYLTREMEVLGLQLSDI
jgi:hypothetical protein